MVGKKSYTGLLECPFRSGFIEFKFNYGDRVSELLESIEARWGTDYGWATPEGIVDIDRFHDQQIFGFAEGWLIAVEDVSGAYVVLGLKDLIPKQPPLTDMVKELPAHGWYEGDLEHGCYNRESFGWPRDDEHLRIPFRRTYKIPDKSNFDVCLIALVAVNGG